MSPYLTKQEGIYSVILPIYNVAYNRASVFSLQIFLSPLSPAPLKVLIAAYCCFATPSMSTPAISVAPFCEICAPIGGFSEMGHRMLLIAFSPTDPRCHGNEIWDIQQGNETKSQS